jgi:hypothetical protein
MANPKVVESKDKLFVLRLFEDWPKVHEKLAVLRLPSPEREIEIVEEARTAQSYDWRLLSHDFLSFGLSK